MSELNRLVIEMLLAPTVVQILRETVGKGRRGTQLSPFSSRELGRQTHLREMQYIPDSE